MYLSKLNSKKSPDFHELTPYDPKQELRRNEGSTAGPAAAAAAAAGVVGSSPQSSRGVG